MIKRFYLRDKQQERSNAYLYRLFQGFVYTEKGNILAENHNKYTFEVSDIANNIDVARAAKLLFNEEVISVNISNLKGKHKNFRRIPGKQSDVKRAVITFKNKIDMEKLWA